MTGRSREFSEKVLEIKNVKDPVAVEKIIRIADEFSELDYDQKMAFLALTEHHPHVPISENPIEWVNHEYGNLQHVLNPHVFWNKSTGKFKSWRTVNFVHVDPRTGIKTHVFSHQFSYEFELPCDANRSTEDFVMLDDESDSEALDRYNAGVNVLEAALNKIHAATESLSPLELVHYVHHESSVALGHKTSISRRNNIHVSFRVNPYERLTEKIKPNYGVTDNYVNFYAEFALFCSTLFELNIDIVVHGNEDSISAVVTHGDLKLNFKLHSGEVSRMKLTHIYKGHVFKESEDTFVNIELFRVYLSDFFISDTPIRKIISIAKSQVMEKSLSEELVRARMLPRQESTEAKIELIREYGEDRYVSGILLMRDPDQSAQFGFPNKSSQPRHVNIWSDVHELGLDDSVYDSMFLFAKETGNSLAFKELITNVGSPLMMSKIPDVLSDGLKQFVDPNSPDEVNTLRTLLESMLEVLYSKK